MQDNITGFGNDEELLAIFIEEARDQLDVLDQGLVSLESDADDTQLVQAIFRAAHTMKSSAAAMGFHRMADLTHAMEDVLDRIRERSLDVTPDVVEPLLKGVDCLRSMERRVSAGATDSDDGGTDLEIAASLREIATAFESATAMAEESSGGPESLSANGIPVHIAFARDCLMPSMRAFMAIREMEKLGTITDLVPSREQIDRGDIGLDLRAVLAEPVDIASLKRVLSRIAEVDEVFVGLGEPGRPHEPVIPQEPAPAPARVITPDVPAASPAETPPTGDPRKLASARPQRPPTPKASPAPASSAAPEAVSGEGFRQQNVRVNVDTLDHILNLVGELVLNRARMLQIKVRLEDAHPNDDRIRELDTVTQQLGAVVSELHTKVLEARMLPVKVLYSRFPRMVRDLCRGLGKDVDFVVEGENELLDRSVMERLVDPLTHILRNAVDHGMELPGAREAQGKSRAGTIRLATRRREENIEIQVSDDGPGVNLGRVLEKAVATGLVTAERAAAMQPAEVRALIFSSGLSTAQAVSEVSGRGVGMDVVKRDLDALGGTVLVDSEPGMGTTLTMTIPLTLAIVRALVVRVGETDIAVPLAVAEETVKVRPADLHSVGGQLAMRWRDQIVPVVILRDTLRGLGEGADQVRIPVVVVRHIGRIIGLAVEAVMGHQEIVVKPLGAFIGDIPGIGGATILGNGRIALILDTGSLFSARSRSTTTRAMAQH